MFYDLRFTKYGVQCTVTVYGLRFTVYGLTFTLCALRSAIYTVGDLQFTLHAQRSGKLVRGCRTVQPVQMLAGGSGKQTGQALKLKLQEARMLYWHAAAAMGRGERGG